MSGTIVYDPPSSSGTVDSVTNTDGTITVTGTSINPVVSRTAITGDVAVSAGSDIAALQSSSGVEAIIAANSIVAAAIQGTATPGGDLAAAGSTYNVPLLKNTANSTSVVEAIMTAAGGAFYVNAVYDGVTDNYTLIAAQLTAHPNAAFIFSDAGQCAISSSLSLTQGQLLVWLANGADFNSSAEITAIRGGLVPTAGFSATGFLVHAIGGAAPATQGQCGIVGGTHMAGTIAGGALLIDSCEFKMLGASFVGGLVCTVVAGVVANNNAAGFRINDACHINNTQNSAGGALALIVNGTDMIAVGLNKKGGQAIINGGDYVITGCHFTGGTTGTVGGGASGAIALGYMVGPTTPSAGHGIGGTNAYVGANLVIQGQGQFSSTIIDTANGSFGAVVIDNTGVVNQSAVYFSNTKWLGGGPGGNPLAFNPPCIFHNNNSEMPVVVSGYAFITGNKTGEGWQGLIANVNLGDIWQATTFIAGYGFAVSGTDTQPTQALLWPTATSTSGTAWAETGTGITSPIIPNGTPVVWGGHSYGSAIAIAPYSGGTPTVGGTPLVRIMTALTNASTTWTATLNNVLGLAVGQTMTITPGTNTFGTSPSGTQTLTAVNAAPTNTVTFTATTSTGSMTGNGTATSIVTNSTTTAIMAGCGFQYIPLITGNLRVSISMVVSTATAVAAVTISGRYGTGTPPLNGASPTGTIMGDGTIGGLKPQAIGSNLYVRREAVITGVTLGIPLYIDFTILTGTSSDAASASAVYILVEETS